MYVLQKLDSVLKVDLVLDKSGSEIASVSESLCCACVGVRWECRSGRSTIRRETVLVV